MIKTKHPDYPDNLNLVLIFGIIFVRNRFIINAIMKNLILILLVPGFLLLSCTKDKIKINPNHPPIGLWTYSDNQGEVQIFLRTLEFSDNHGYKFNTDGTLIEREISGWCATPPVSYANYAGTWTQVSNSIIEINVKYWGGTDIYRLEIVALTSDSLKVISHLPI